MRHYNVFLKSRSELALVAQTAKYFFAKLDKVEYSCDDSFHHNRESSSKSNIESFSRSVQQKIVVQEKEQAFGLVSLLAT